MSTNQQYLQVPSTYDGPSDTRSQGSPGRSSQHGGSQHGGSQRIGTPAQSPARSQGGGSHMSPGGGSRSRAESGASSGRPRGESGAQRAPSGNPSPFPPGTGRDPALEPGRRPQGMNTRIDLPPEAFVQNPRETPFARRPKFCDVGRQVMINVNQFRVTALPTSDIYQYDVTVSPHVDKPAFVRKLWNTRTVQDRLRGSNCRWLFDGEKLAWSRAAAKDGVRILVDMDEEKGQKPRPGRNNRFEVILKSTTTIRLQALDSYLKGEADWHNHVLECMSFLDHLLRQGPSENLLAIRRNFYHREAPVHQLDKFGAIVARKGIYASMRLSQNIGSPGCTGLGVNVDIANTAFWGQGLLIEFIKVWVRGLPGIRWTGRDEQELAQLFKPAEKDQFDDRGAFIRSFWDVSPAFQHLRKLHRLKFTIQYRGKENDPKTYTIMRFMYDPKFGQAGADALTYKFDWDGKMTSVDDFFRKKYKLFLKYPKMPLIETSRSGVYPIEVCHLLPFQRYNFKLDPDQTSSMIKFAVTRPPVRGKAIMDNVNLLKWTEDPYLREFGMKIDPRMTPVPSRVLQNPEIQFGNGKHNPGTTGRWDLRGKKFMVPAVRPITRWAVVVIDRCLDAPTATRFAKAFSDTYKNHGGRIEGAPYVTTMQYHGAMGINMSNMFKDMEVKLKGAPDFLLVVLADKLQFVYERLKKSFEVRWAVMTQMVQKVHVTKCQPQYCSNVAMKVNAKFGGSTSRIPRAGSGSAFFNAPTMMIGVDLTHGAPGVASPTIAAMTISMDKDAATYAASCQTNGFRVEIIQPGVMRSMFTPYLQKWCEKMKCMPKHVFYLRDGVAEGQFAQVMEYEIAEIKRCFKKISSDVPKITVIVATKRHNIRFFPQTGGDKNGNALPGTLVEREVTHPYHYDFYLCSHVAIQGTARPVHYHVLHDEVQMKADDLQKMIYHQCYQYVRSTTPVSLHPAVYYAHLASARARCHEAASSSKRDPVMSRAKVESDAKASLSKADMPGYEPDRTTDMRGQDSLPLMRINADGEATAANTEWFKSTMWYI